MRLQKCHLDPLLREQEGEHRSGRTTSYDTAGGLLGSLYLGLRAQLCRRAHGQLLSEWAVNETVKKRGTEESATCCGLALTFALLRARRRSSPPSPAAGPPSARWPRRGRRGSR